VVREVGIVLELGDILWGIPIDPDEEFPKQVDILMGVIQRPPHIRRILGVAYAHEKSAPLLLRNNAQDNARALCLAFFEVRKTYASVWVNGSAKAE
jgi:hypothetical protein